MRSILLGLCCLLIAGCGESAVTLSGGKPLSHWIEALGDRDPQVRKQAVTKLGNAGTSDPAVLPALLGALKDQDPLVRCQAILALVKSRGEAREAIDPLRELAKNDRDRKVREYAAKALQTLETATGDK